MVLAGNIICMIGCLLMVSIGFVKNKKHILAAQCAQFGIQGVGNLVLGAAGGFVSGLVSVLRILVFTWVKKVTVWLKLGFIALQVVLTLWTGGGNWLEWLPVLSMVLYTWYLDTDNTVLFKLVNAFGLCMWVVYDLFHSNYVSVAFDVMTIASTMIGIHMILKSNKKTGQ